MHEVLVNRLGGLSLPRKSVVRLTDRPDMALDVYRGRKTTNQQQQSHLTDKSSRAWHTVYVMLLSDYMLDYSETHTMEKSDFLTPIIHSQFV